MRALDRVLALLVCLGLLALCVLVVGEVLVAATDNGQWVLAHDDLSSWLRNHRWNDSSVVVASVGAGVVGLILLVLELRRRRPGQILLAPRTDGVTTSVTRGSLEAAARRAALDVDGVTRVRSRANRRRLTLAATSRRQEPEGLDDALRTQVTERIDRLGLARPLKVATSVDRRTT